MSFRVVVIRKAKGIFISINFSFSLKFHSKTMGSKSMLFDEQAVLAHLRHYLPAQGALKDFVHHNTLHAFQAEHFKEALFNASKILGYSTYLSIDEFREYYAKGRIKDAILDKVIEDYLEGNSSTIDADAKAWKNKMLKADYSQPQSARIGSLRKHWNTAYSINMDKAVYPVLLRLLSSFLDQGISHWTFPNTDLSFFDAVIKLSENGGFAKIFRSQRVQEILLKREYGIENLLNILVGSAQYYEDYLFDQQFSHAGWSGFVNAVEKKPEYLFAKRKISLGELIQIELLLEIDALDRKYGNNWQALASCIKEDRIAHFAAVPDEDLKTVQYLWQMAFEFSYFNEVFLGIEQTAERSAKEKKTKSFQALCCIDDRCYSIRRHIESLDENCETFGTPGFFGIEFFFKPESSKFYTKACPNPITPAYIIPEKGRKEYYKKDMHLNRASHDLFSGWFLSNTLGFSSVFQLVKNLFKPSATPLMASSYAHMDRKAKLQIDATGELLNGLKVGFTIEEMVSRLKYVFSSIGLRKDFADIVYIIGHGGSSVNNTYYAGYDCGACCGRPGSVNARVFAYMANKQEVRTALEKEGIIIPKTTIFLGGMHDTTKDEIQFYDEEEIIGKAYEAEHAKNLKTLEKALQMNAKERSYRFEEINQNSPIEKIHEEVKKRAVSIFQTRPEWNHTAAALTIIGRSNLFKHLYLDKRAFANSYDYTIDPEGKLLSSILKASIPVSGGIALEYYFSRVDQQKLGSGSKLPHNVVGLFAVSNGIEGDLRPGLPSQMIEIHEPLRMLFIIEHNPEIVLKVLESDKGLYEWVNNEWVLFTVYNSASKQWYIYKNNGFVAFKAQEEKLKSAEKPEEVYHTSAQKNLLIIP